MAYDPVSKTGGRKAVRVQLPPSAQFCKVDPKGSSPRGRAEILRGKPKKR